MTGIPIEGCTSLLWIQASYDTQIGKSEEFFDAVSASLPVILREQLGLWKKGLTRLTLADGRVQVEICNMPWRCFVNKLHLIKPRGWIGKCSRLGIGFREKCKCRAKSTRQFLRLAQPDILQHHFDSQLPAISSIGSEVSIVSDYFAVIPSRENVTRLTVGRGPEEKGLRHA